MEHGETFCVKGSLILTEVEWRGKGCGEEGVLTEAWHEGTGREGTAEQRHTHTKPSGRRRLGKGQDNFGCAVRCQLVLERSK